MSEYVAVALDFYQLGEWGSLGTPVVISLVGGTLLFFLQRYFRREDQAEAAEKSSIQTNLAHLAFRIESECELRQNQYAQLGRDISRVREAVAHLAGKRGHPPPQFPE